MVLWLILYLAHGLGMLAEPGDVLGFLFLATFLGGVPYLIVGGILSWRLRRASLRTLRIASLCAPLIYAFLIFAMVSAVLLTETSDGNEGFLAVETYVGSAVGLGYGYVALVHLAYFALRRMGVICESRPAG